MGRFAFVLAFEFVIAPPNYSAVFAGGVPHFGAEESTTVTADDTGGENALSAVLATDSFAPLNVTAFFGLPSAVLSCEAVPGLVQMWQGQ